MDASRYRERVYEIFAETDRDLEPRVADALAVGSEYLDLPIGFLTRIEDGVQEIVVSTGGHETVQSGETCPLDEAYCRRTVETDDVLAARNAAASTEISDAAVRRFDLGTYVGVKVVADDETYGTVCFADVDERACEFSEAETVFVELLGRLVGQAIERRRYDRRLRERNERLRREKRRFEGIAETSFDVLFRLDLAGRFTYVSGTVEETLGYAPADLIGERFLDTLVGESVQRAMAAYEDALAGGAIGQLELDFRAADGDRVILEVNAAPITEDGEVVEVQGAGRDVTARRERERELRMKTRAIDEADIGIAIADADRPDTPLVYVNDGFEQVTGYAAEEALGRNCRFLQGPATDPDAVARLREAVEAGRPVSVELINYRADGTPYWSQVRLSPVADEAGEVTNFLGFQTDVTERKRTASLVELLNRVLRHNLRNDMNAIGGFGELLRDGDGEPERLGARIVTLAAKVTELSDQAHRLERVARRDRDPRRLDPRTLLEEAAAVGRREYPEASVTVDVRTDRGICAGPELSTAVEELVDNGLKHDPGPDPAVAMTADDDGTWVELVVADDGPGVGEMESEVIAAGRETALEHGTGLGLWLVNWIVTRYGGSFQIRGADDGTVATARLPAIGHGESVESAVRRPTVLFQ